MPPGTNIQSLLDIVTQMQQQQPSAAGNLVTAQGKTTGIADQLATLTAPEPQQAEELGRGQNLLRQLASIIENYGATSNPFTAAGDADFLGDFEATAQEQADRLNAAERLKFGDERSSLLQQLQIATRGEDIALGEARHQEGRQERFDDKLEAVRIREADARNRRIENKRADDRRLAGQKDLIELETRLRAAADKRNDDKFSRETTLGYTSDADAIMEGGFNPVTGQLDPSTSVFGQMDATDDPEERKQIAFSALARLENLKKKPEITGDGIEYIQGLIDRLRNQVEADASESPQPTDTGAGGGFPTSPGDVVRGVIGAGVGGASKLIRSLGGSNVSAPGFSSERADDLDRR